MKTKKSNKANLEKKRILLFQIGLIMAFSLALIAFEWNTPGNEIKDMEYASSDIDDVTEVIATQRIKEMEIPKQAIMDLDIVNNEVEIVDEIIPVDEEELYKNFMNIDIDMEPEEHTKDSIFVTCERMPEFPGDFRQWVYSHLRYPTLAEEIGLEGQVIVKFIVGKDGKIKDITILRSAHKVFEDEVIRVLERAPKWKPGLQLKEPVKVIMTMPIKFELRNR